MESLTFVEIDISIDETINETFRFTFPSEQIYHDAIPALTSVSVTPAVVDPGVSIGARASVNVSLKDFQYPLLGTLVDSGSFFGKLRAVKKSLQGSALRVIRGEVGDELADMVTEHYVAESLSRTGEKVSIVAKDILKLADGDRAQAPAISNGRVLADIDDNDLALTLTPTGIGALEYPASGRAAIGGSEIVSFTRAGDLLTIVRALSGTEAKTHEADELVQIVLEYVGESPADLVYDLLTNYTEIDASWLPLAEWQADIDTYIGRLYSAEIASPTAVKKLLDELIEQTGLVMWWDAVNQRVRLKSLRPVTGGRVVSTDEMMADSFSFDEQPAKRASEIWTYFALRNPLSKLDDVQNYKSVLITADPAAEIEYGQPAIRKVFSRWIAVNNRPAASRLNGLLISRYRDPPRRFSFDLYRTSESASLGQGLQLEHWALQDADGAVLAAPVQVTSLEAEEDRYIIDAEEMLFSDFEDPDDPDTGGDSRLIIIDTDSYNINLRTLHDTFYTAPETYDSIICIIEADVKVGSTSTSLPALDVGSWPASVDILIRVQGRIQGRGGNSGSPGGTALLTTYPVTVDNDGQIYGGGGGGGLFTTGGVTPTFYGGGGGAGFDPGVAGGPGFPGSPGTTEGGGEGASGLGGDGGDPGQPGDAASVAGGAAGNAIDGVSLVVIDTSSAGTIEGPQVN